MRTWVALGRTRQLDARLATLRFRQLVGLCPCSELPAVQDALLNLQLDIAVQDPVAAQRSNLEGHFC